MQSITCLSIGTYMAYTPTDLETPTTDELMQATEMHKKAQLLIKQKYRLGKTFCLSGKELGCSNLSPGVATAFCALMEGCKWRCWPSSLEHDTFCISKN